MYGPTLWLGQDQLENRHLLYGVCGKEVGSDEVDWGGVLGPQIRGLSVRGLAQTLILAIE